jgi:glycosyltransferase involved in cell wall biosynthesis
VRVGIACFGHGLGATGGVQVHLRGLLEALASSDSSGNSYVLLLGPDEPEPPEARQPRFSVERVADRGLAAGPRWSRVARALLGSTPAIERLGLDCVHYPATRLLHPLRRTPVVLTFFDMQEELLPGFFTRRERLARRLLHRWGVRRARLVIAPSRFTADCLVERYRTAPQKIALVPAGVPQRCFAPAGAGEAAWLRARGLEPGEYALYPANPWPHKNHAALMRAWARLEPRERGAPTLVCTGRLENESRRVDELARAAGLPPGRVRDLGFVSEEALEVLLRGARLLVYPSLLEGFGLPVAEALAAGCPVACSDLPPLRELGGDAARFFDPGSAASIAEAVKELWEGEAQRSLLVERGRDRARALAWPALLPQLLAAYARAAGGH